MRKPCHGDHIKQWAAEARGEEERRQREADGQHSVWFAWHLLSCNRKLRKELQWDQKKRKNTETHKYSEEQKKQMY